jgi:adenylate kinase family enzyme
MDWLDKAKQGFSQIIQRMASKSSLGFLGFAGNLCSGKSLKRYLITELLLQPHSKGVTMVSADMSDVIKEAMKLNNSLGDSARSCKNIVDDGGYVPDNVAIPILEDWMARVSNENPELCAILLSGFPRTKTQGEFCLDTFRTTLVINTCTTRQQAWADFNRPDRRKQGRSDDCGGEALFNKRWHLGETETPPTMELLNGKVLHVHRHDPLIRRIPMGLGWLYSQKEPVVKPRLIRRAIGKAKNPMHPVHQKIAELDAQG